MQPRHAGEPSRLNPNRKAGGEPGMSAFDPLRTLAEMIGHGRKHLVRVWCLRQQIGFVKLVFVEEVTPAKPDAVVCPGETNSNVWIRSLNEGSDGIKSFRVHFQRDALTDLHQPDFHAASLQR